MLTKKLITSWTVFWLLIMVHIQHASGIDGGRIYKYSCNCAKAAECKKDDLACTSCAAGYYGDTCQTKNVAPRKTADQFSTFSTIIIDTLTTIWYSAFPAVDGNPCTHTAPPSNGWWYVDLGDEYSIRYLRVYIRKKGVFQDILRGFTVRIGSSAPQLNTLSLCHQHSDFPSLPKVINVTCTRTMRGRYVHISLETRFDFLTLCEVQVFACTAYFFGTDCNKICRCKIEFEVCDKVTGHCPSGCAAGYMGDDCQTECPMNRYGDCVTSCSTHCKPVTVGTRQCNFISGDCTDTTGCQAGYMGPKCDQGCPMNYYGDCRTKCSTHCIAVNGEERCDFISGNCINPVGCQEGYLGARCDQTCPVNYYGDCITSCSKHCLTVDGGKRHCSFISGHCANGCQAGYTGSRCDQECADRLFGLGCAKRCNCMDETEACNKRTGACSSGCAADFEGQDCKTVAADGLKIAAIVIGGLLVLALIAALFIIYKQRRRLHVYTKVTQTKATQTKASLVDQVVQLTYQDLVHNIDARGDYMYTRRLLRQRLLRQRPVWLIRLFNRHTRI